jgi:hypothetical protein
VISTISSAGSLDGSELGASDDVTTMGGFVAEATAFGPVTAMEKMHEEPAETPNSEVTERVFPAALIVPVEQAAGPVTDTPPVKTRPLGRTKSPNPTELKARVFGFVILMRKKVCPFTTMIESKIIKGRDFFKS